MTKVFYSAGESRRASPNESPKQPILSDSEADTDIESQQRPTVAHRKNVHRRSESEFSVQEREKQEESTSTHNYKRLRRPGSVVVRQRQSSRDVRDSTGQRPLQKACSRGDLEKVKELLEDSPDLQDRDYAGTTALHSAALIGHSGVVGALLEAGAVPDVRSGPEELDTPLMDAAANGYLSVVQQLLGAGADPRINNAIGRRAIDFALEELASSSKSKDPETERRTNIVRELNSRTRSLRKSGAPIIDSPNHSLAHPSLYPPGFTGVQRSPPPIFLDVLRRSVREEVIEHAANGDLPYVGLALERGWQPNAKALVNAAKYGHSEVVGLLLAFGMDANAKYEGSTALQEAIERDHYACAKLLVDSGAVIHRSYAQYVADLPQNSELRQLVVGTMALPSSSYTRSSIDDDDSTTIANSAAAESKQSKSKSPKPDPSESEVKPRISDSDQPKSSFSTASVDPTAPSSGLSAPKMDLRAIKPKKRSKSTLDGPSSTPKEKSDASGESKLADSERVVSPSPRQSPAPEPKPKVSFKEDNEEMETKEDDIPKTEEHMKEDTPVDDSEEARKTPLPHDSPKHDPKEGSDSNKKEEEHKSRDDAKAWAERSQELSQLAELKEKQRRDREAKMLASLRRHSEGNDTAVTSSQSPTPSPGPSTFGSRKSSPAAPDSNRASSVDAESAAASAVKTTSAAASVIAEATDGSSSPQTEDPKISVSNLPWAVRQLSYTGQPQSVGPLYVHVIGGVPHCIDLQAALALGEPRIQKKYHDLDNKVITHSQKNLLWGFCQLWICRPGAKSTEIQKDKAAFLELGMCWVPVHSIKGISLELDHSLRFLPIQLYQQPIRSSFTSTPSLKNRNLPLIWQYKTTSGQFQ